MQTQEKLTENEVIESLRLYLKKKGWQISKFCKGLTLAIAHPDDADIRKSIGTVIPFLKLLKIKHYRIRQNGGEVIEN